MRITKGLEGKKVLTVRQFEASEGNHRNWYTINYDVLEDLRKEFDKDPEETEETPENSDESGHSDIVSPSIVPSCHDDSDNVSPSLIRKRQSVTILNHKSKNPSKTPPRGEGGEEEFGIPEVSRTLTLSTEVEEISEPSYVDVDADGLELDITPSVRNPKWRQPTSDLCKKALSICSRKYFKTKQERSRWIKIEKGILPLGHVGNSQPRYPLEWVEAILDWAKEKNSSRFAKAIQFPNLLKALENEESRNDFVNETLAERMRTGTIEDDPDPLGEPDSAWNEPIEFYVGGM